MLTHASIVCEGMLASVNSVKWHCINQLLTYNINVTDDGKAPECDEY